MRCVSQKIGKTEQKLQFSLTPFISEDLQKPIETVTQSTDETARPENEKQKASDVGTSILVANLTGNFEKVNENLNEILRCCKDHCDVAERRANPVNINDSKVAP
uniref:Uncharacterized protein n=1 Tax=Parascaris equorum TaxID=6256 RepID=A0A914RB39_PAREQ